MVSNVFHQCFSTVAIFALQVGLIATMHGMLVHDGSALYAGVLSGCAGVAGVIALWRPAIRRTERLRRDPPQRDA